MAFGQWDSTHQVINDGDVVCTCLQTIDSRVRQGELFRNSKFVRILIYQLFPV
ncbi:unknown [Prevotella sp. CAG:255]|nr:unknown [Prevotella sp. CAG:255]